MLSRQTRRWLTLGVDNPGVKKGDVVTDQVRYSREAVGEYASLVGDMNPIHLDRETGRESVFGENIVHGMLTGSAFSKVIANTFHQSVYLSQTLNFRKPVFMDETLLVTISVEKIRGQVLWLETVLAKETSGEEVIRGQAVIMYKGI